MFNQAAPVLIVEGGVLSQAPGLVIRENEEVVPRAGFCQFLDLLVYFRRSTHKHMVRTILVPPCPDPWPHLFALLKLFEQITEILLGGMREIDVEALPVEALSIELVLVTFTI